MGNAATLDALILRWSQAVRDPALADLPYKIELNNWLKLELSPTTNRRGRLQARLASDLARQLPEGESITECSVLTDIGVRVPDVAWASNAFLAVHAASTPFPSAPEICAEIISPSNSDDEIQEKIRAYLAAGAREVWIVTENGSVTYYGATGKLSATSFGILVTLPDLSK